LVLKKGNSETKLSGDLSYNPLVKEAVAPDNATDFIPWSRAKVVIPSKDGTINVKLIVPGDNGEQVRKVVTSIADLRKDFAFGCVAQFYLKIQTFWVQKTATKGKRECGFKVVCDMINIVERSKLSGKANVEWDDLLGDDEFAKPSKQPVKEVKKVTKDESDKSSSDSDDDKKDAKSDASDSESEPEPEPEPVKKETKAKATKETTKETKSKTKKGSKKESDDEASDDDTAKKPAKGGKSKGK